MDIKATGPIKELPDGMIVIRDQTAIKYVPSSDWTMAAEGSKRVEIVSIDGKHQITATMQGVGRGISCLYTWCMKTTPQSATLL